MANVDFVSCCDASLLDLSKVIGTYSRSAYLMRRCHNSYSSITTMILLLTVLLWAMIGRWPIVSIILVAHVNSAAGISFLYVRISFYICLGIGWKNRK